AGRVRPGRRARGRRCRPGCCPGRPPRRRSWSLEWSLALPGGGGTPPAPAAALGSRGIRIVLRRAVSVPVEPRRAWAGTGRDGLCSLPRCLQLAPVLHVGRMAVGPGQADRQEVERGPEP